MSLPAERLENAEALVESALMEELNMSSIDADANFFQLGGTSLMMIVILEKIESVRKMNFDVGVAMQAFFEAVTMSELVQRLAEIATPAEQKRKDPAQ